MTTVRPVVLSIGFVAILVLVLFLSFYVHSDDHSHNVRAQQLRPSRSPDAPSPPHSHYPPSIVSLPCSTRLATR